MAYSTVLAARIREVLHDRKITFVEKPMMGGLCYMVTGKMCVGIVEEKLMARIDPDRYEEALQQPGCRKMDFTGKPMRGFVFVEGKGIQSRDDLERWVDLALEFNPKAKASNKLKKQPKG